MRKLSIFAFIGLIFFQWAVIVNANSASLKEAFDNRLSDVQVKGAGTVVRILKDDIKGSKHQRFILRVSSEQTILIAHNIDLAPKINSIANGDQVKFYGEYEWNRKGGVVHWTHHDPGGRHVGGRHVGGWLKHKGRMYQ
ncbi:MAG: DUF3465 domain-containing protein [Colwellia sp.]|nr:DUF3465 domain-containing protein [Colwellia sp.]